MGDHEPADGDDEDGRLLVIAARDPEAFGALYDRNYTRVLAYFYRRTYCRHTAADLTAETFAQAWQQRCRYDSERGTGRAWIFGIAGNLFKQWLRQGVVRTKARRDLSIATPPITDDDLARIDDLVDSFELRTALQSALHTLSAPARDAVLLRVGLDLPYEQVAALCGCSVGTARVRVSRAMHTLTEALEVNL